MPGLFISGTGTEVGKTFVTRGLARALRRRGRCPQAIKPFETGVDPIAEDADAIARAAGHPPLHEGLYRARQPLSPYAITLLGDHDGPLMERCEFMIRELEGQGFLLVEGAGGVLVPLDSQHTVADFAASLGLPLLLVADDRLGTLSHTACAIEAARRRGLQIAAVALNRCRGEGPGSNADVLRRTTDAPIVCVRPCVDDDEALADEIELSGLIEHLDPG